MVATPPESLSRFIGRDDAVAAVERLLAGSRLLTLTGAGGSGKTRLASHVAKRAASAYPDGVTWVELAPVREAARLPETVLAAIGAEQGSRPALDVLLDVLRDRTTLLVLDNCEHLVSAVAELAETLLLAAPGLRVLATSREALGISGEQAWLVPGLSLPGAASAPDSIGAAESVQLFVDRAQSALATFRLTSANAPAIARIVRRLDGLPLAIELAAARVRTLTPEQLADRLDDDFRLLTSGARTAVARHRTLRGAIDWSYQLLDARERLLLQRLSVFAGDVAIEQIEEVCAADDLDASDVLDVLALLVDKSLVVVQEVGATARYRLLETIRQFAHEKLTEAGDVAVRAARHARVYATVVRDAAPHFITRDRPFWVARVQRELDNVRLALAHTREHDLALHVRLAGQLGWFWYSSGLWTEGRRWSEGAIAASASTTVAPAPGGASAERATLLLGAGVIASLQSDNEAAITWLHESAAHAHALSDRSTESYALAYIGIASTNSGGDGRASTERALTWFESVEDLYGLRLAHVVLSSQFLLRGDLAAAQRHAEAGARFARAFGLDRELGIALQIHGMVVLALEDLPHAGTLFRESLAALRRDPSTFWIARALELLGIVTCRLGDPRRGVLFLGAANACRASIGAVQFEHDRKRLEPMILAAREALGDDGFEHAWADGRARPLTDILTEAAEPLTVVAEASAPAPAPEEQLTPVLDVRALGALEIRRDGVLLDGDAWRFARPRELFLYLLAHPAGRTREQIGVAFWPDASAAQVKNNFHVALHHMRKALGRADLIAFDDDRYRVRWELGVRFDARDFADAVQPAIRQVKAARPGADVAEPLGRIWRAVESYRGDFLQDESAGDWHLETRDHLRRLYTDGLLLLGQHLMHAEDYAAAAELYGRVIAAEELSEEAHRRLMLCLARSGDRTGALRQYERLRDTLLRELDAEPESETTALFDRLRRAERV